VQPCALVNGSHFGVGAADFSVFLIGGRLIGGFAGGFTARTGVGSVTADSGSTIAASLATVAAGAGAVGATTEAVAAGSAAAVADSVGLRVTHKPAPIPTPDSTTSPAITFQVAPRQLEAGVAGMMGPEGDRSIAGPNEDSLGGA
jgi:hypothetical protein